MIPTNYFRWLRLPEFPNTLQQWWYDENQDAAKNGWSGTRKNALEPHYGFGEWRNVPVALDE